MSERFHSPEGALRSNLGLLAGTIIQELRMHPYIDDGLNVEHWNYRPEYMEFTILSVQRDPYRCRYSGEEDAFWWPVWGNSPTMASGGMAVRLYGITSRKSRCLRHMRADRFPPSMGCGAWKSTTRRCFFRTRMPLL